jgi:hypothetical protein
MIRRMPFIMSGIQPTTLFAAPSRTSRFRNEPFHCKSLISNDYKRPKMSGLYGAKF